MCLAIPGEIIEINGDVATVRIGEALIKASLMLLPDGADPGEYVIVHAGFALNKLDPEEARESLRLIRELAECGSGEDLP